MPLAQNNRKSVMFALLERISEGRRLKIYIIPTWYCFLFNIFVLFVISYGFANRSVSVLTTCFLILFIEILSMIEAHINLREIGLELVDCPPVVAGGSGHMTIKISSRTQSFGVHVYVPDHDGLNEARGLFFRKPKIFQTYALKEISKAWKFWKFNQVHSLETEFAISSSPEFLRLRFVASQRGIHDVPRVVLSSAFPFGMFRVWREFSLAGTYASYPKVAGFPFASKKDQGQSRNASGVGITRALDAADAEYAGHKNFHTGDSLRRIDWKASSRRGEKLAKLFSGGSGGASRSLRLGDTTQASLEQRLEQLAFWIHEAHDAKVMYRIEIPSMISPFGADERHKNHCLTILAAFAPSDDSVEATL